MRRFYRCSGRRCGSIRPIFNSLHTQDKERQCAKWHQDCELQVEQKKTTGKDGQTVLNRFRKWESELICIMICVSIPSHSGYCIHPHKFVYPYTISYVGHNRKRNHALCYAKCKKKKRNLFVIKNFKELTQSQLFHMSSRKLKVIRKI